MVATSPFAEWGPFLPENGGFPLRGKSHPGCSGAEITFRMVEARFPPGTGSDKSVSPLRWDVTAGRRARRSASAPVARESVTSTPYSGGLLLLALGRGLELVE